MKYSLAIVAVLATMTYGHVLPLVSYVQPDPQFNSAIVQSDQAGGNFAYSVSEGQAVQAISPVISSDIHPVYTYQWAGGVPALGPNVILQYPYWGSVIPSVPLWPGVVPAPPSASGPSPDDESGIETVTDEADNQPEDNEPSKQDDSANDDSVSIESA